MVQRSKIIKVRKQVKIKGVWKQVKDGTQALLAKCYTNFCNIMIFVLYDLIESIDLMLLKPTKGGPRRLQATYSTQVQQTGKQTINTWRWLL